MYTTLNKIFIFCIDIPIFSSITKDLEEEHLNQLKRVSFEFQCVVAVFKELQRSNAVTDKEGCEELETRLRITNYLAQV